MGVCGREWRRERNGDADGRVLGRWVNRLGGQESEERRGEGRESGRLAG